MKKPEKYNNKEHETWGDTPDVDVKCKIRLGVSKILTKLNHVPPDKSVPEESKF